MGRFVTLPDQYDRYETEGRNFKCPSFTKNLIITSLKTTSVWFTVLIKTFHKPDTESLDVKLVFGEPPVFSWYYFDE